MSFRVYNPLAKTVSFEAKEYDVFLSFRGEDTRKNFVDHLHAALENAKLKVFLDKNSVKEGDEVSSTILGAIENSKIRIPIFSRNYANSHWCLEEVSHMFKSGGPVVPLFYDVSPRDVRHSKEGPFREALSEKIVHYGEEKVEEWRKALFQASATRGWSMDDTAGYEALLVKKVVNHVFKTLKYPPDESDDEETCPCEPPKSVEENYPGAFPLERTNEPQTIRDMDSIMEEPISTIIDMLKTDSEDGKYTVAIYGKAGSGKTFLAKAVHNRIRRKFKAACFVSDVRHKSQHANGTTKMQRQILKDLVKFEGKVIDESHGKSLMRDRLRCVKALVILEYVDDIKQLDTLKGEWFGPGSRIIVTTLDCNLLNGGQVNFFYEMRVLDRNHALQHFTWHAFLRDRPNEGYERLCQRALDICKGLPLLQKILGAYLYDKSTIEWENTLQSLHQMDVSQDNYAVIRHCYYGLNDEKKEMFLDMACLFIGRKKESVISFWEANGFNSKSALSDMEEKSLISLTGNDRFVMHSELRDVGRTIVASESSEVGEQSRLFKLQDAEAVLCDGKGTDKVRYLTHIQQGVKLQTDCFQGMTNLLLLWLDGVHIEGDFALMPKGLKWLRWENCPLKCLPPDWSMNHLVVLDLSFSKEIEKLMGALSDDKRLQHLKVLKLNECTTLQTIPDLAYHRSLIRLELCGCSGLKELSDSISALSDLRHLDLSNCHSLSSLPESITVLTSLEVLFLSNCHKIQRLPDAFENITSLKKIRLTGTRLQMLPNSFRWLSCLGKLTLYGCHELKSLPQSIGELNQLHYLDIHGCFRIKAVPESFYVLKNLTYLDMSGCKRVILEDELGSLVKLEKLNLSNCQSLRRLPQSICKLKNLLQLNLNDCISLFQLPEELGDLTNLEELFINRCHNLYKLPQSIGQLSKLHILEMDKNYSISSLPSSFSSLTSLEKLIFGACYLPEWMGDFKSLEFLCLKSLKCSYLPESFSALPRLYKLCLYDCMELEELPCLPNSLTEVCIQNCLGLNDISRLSGTKKLKRLRIHNCRRLVGLPDFSSFLSLQELSIVGCGNLKGIAGLEGLNLLRILQLASCRLNGAILKPRQLIKKTRCLELLSFSSNGIPGSLQHNIKDARYDINIKISGTCSGIVLCFLTQFTDDITLVSVELSIEREGKEVFSTKLLNHARDAMDDQIFVHILRDNHPLVTMFQDKDVLGVNMPNEKERQLIVDGGIHAFEDDNEDTVLEGLGKDLTLLMEGYSDLKTEKSSLCFMNCL